MAFRFFSDIPAFALTPGGELADPDSGSQPESGLALPWVVDPSSSWLQYRCNLEVRLDPGIVVHYPLPQSNPPADTLSQVAFDDSTLYTNTDGVNTVSQAAAQNFVQRMSPSRYSFILTGFAIRAGYKVPIPGLKSIAGVPAIPDATQIAANILVGNLGGIPLWLGYWELWYLVALPPKAAYVPPDNLALHIAGDQDLPDSVQVPYSQPDQNAKTGYSLQTLQGFIAAGKPGS